MIVGDSVTIGVNAHVIAALKGICQTQLIVGLNALDNNACWNVTSRSRMANTVSWDVVHMNEGLHSLTVNSSDCSGRGAGCETQQQWALELGAWIETIRAGSPAAKIIYATMTPMMAELYEPAFAANRHVVEQLNTLATQTATAHRVDAVNDLYSAVLDKCGGKPYVNCSICDDESKYHPPDFRNKCGFHYTEEGFAFIASRVVDAIKAQLQLERTVWKTDDEPAGPTLLTPNSPPPIFAPPPLSAPWLWFGANASGPESGAQLRFVQRHALAGYGWQHGSERTGGRHTETSLAQAATRLAAATGGSPPRFVYRNMLANWPIFDEARVAAANFSSSGTLNHMFLRNSDNRAGARVCRTRTGSLLYAFPAAEDSFVSEVVSEVASEVDVNAVFFDETDWAACGFDYASVGCANISDEFRAVQLRAKLPAVRRTCAALNKAGKWPILSSKNLLSAAWAGIDYKQRPCVVPHDAYFLALAGASYCRFYEFWMGHGVHVDAACIANALIEGQHGVGLVLRTQAEAPAASCPSCTCPAAQCNCTGCADACPGRGAAHQASATYSIAAFLVVRTNYTYFGISTGWYDADWCWHKEYDRAAACGSPLSAASRSGPYTWSRAYEKCNVSVNTASQSGNLVPL